MKYLLLLLAGCTTGAAAQTPDTLTRCGVTSSFMEKNIDPQLLQQMNAQWQHYATKSKANGRLSADDPVLVVPVMFHIAHLGEAVGEGSNLSEGRIQAALAALNNIYRARGQYAAANDTRIEFVLANCSGIDRANASGVPDFINKGVVIIGTSNQQQVKNIFGTYQNKFVNIYVSHTMTGAGGYAYYGGDMFLTMRGLTNKGDQPENIRLFAHEMGHSLFLNHTFAGDNSCLGCSNNNVVCPANGDPFNNGDQVADTPPHRVTDLNSFTRPYDINPCTNEPFGLDLVKNHMAYNTDASRFSPGQIARMRFYLENYLSYWRNSDAIPTPNNQIALSSIPANVCVGSPVMIGYDNNSGSSNPILLIQKGEDIVYYVDGASSPANFEFPRYRNGYVRDDYTLENGTDYRVRVVAGCNSKISESFQVKNPSQYTALIVGADENNFPNATSTVYLYPCASSSLTLKAKLTFTAQGVTQAVPDSELSAYDFQWTYNGNPIPGATGSTFVVASNRSGGNYRYTATEATCSGTIDSYTNVNVYPSSSAYNFTSDWDGYYPPHSQCEGKAVTLYAGYVSNSATYDWYRDGIVLPGETSRTLSTTATGTYKVVAHDESCSVSSSALDGISLHFGALLDNRIVINSGDSTICNSTYLASTANQPNQGFSYQWLRNGSDIPDANESSLAASIAGIYSLRLTQGNCQSVSNGIDLKKGNKQEKPIITGPKSFINGLMHYLYVENINNAGIEWYKDGQLSTNNLYTHLAVSTSGVYTVRKGYGECAIESDPFIVNFGSTIIPQIESNDTLYVVCNDQSSYLYLRFKERYYENYAGLTFRWMKDGSDLPADQATGMYYYPKEPGVYRLRVSKDGNSGLSNPITVTTTSNRIVKLTAEQGISSTCSDNVVKLIFPDVGNYNIPILWKKDGIILANQYRSKLTAYESGSYTATYHGNGCTVTTEPLPVTIGSEATSATLSGDYAIRTGETANLLLSASAGLTYFFKLSDGSEYTGQGATTLIPKSPNLSTTYSLLSFRTHCGFGSGSGTARIDVTKCPEGTVNYTLATGYWDTPANWSCGSVPTVLDPVLVSLSHTIYLPTNYEAKSKSIELLGQMQQDINTHLRIGQE